MKLPPNRMTGCEGKVPHTTRTAALKAIQTIRKNMTHGFTLNAYRCTFCSNYHVGKTRKRIKV